MFEALEEEKRNYYTEITFKLRSGEVLEGVAHGKRYPEDFTDNFRNKESGYVSVWLDLKEFSKVSVRMSEIISVGTVIKSKAECMGNLGTNDQH